MVIRRDTGFTLPQEAGRILSQTPSQTNGELGIGVIAALLWGGSLILGGGSLWQLHEKREERSDYLKCVEEYTSAPYNMPPSEAGMVCRGEEVKQGFDFGLNSKTFIVVIASVFGMWFVTNLLITAAKKKITGGSK